jgi:hypothetical protein
VHLHPTAERPREAGDVGLERPLLAKVSLEGGHVRRNERAGDRQRDVGAATHRHDFHVLAVGGAPGNEVSGVEAPLDLEGQPLERAERRVAHTERRVVRERDPRPTLPGKELREVCRSGPNQAVHSHVPVGVERMEVVPYPSPHALHRDVLDGNCHAPDVRHGAPGEVDVDGLEDLPSTEDGSRDASTEQCLVHIVVEDPAEPPHVESR